MSFSLPANGERKHPDYVRFSAVTDDPSARVTELLGKKMVFAVPVNSARILIPCPGGWPVALTASDKASAELAPSPANALNQVVRVTYPDGRFQRYAYSTCCPRLHDSVTDRGGGTTVLIHDALKRQPMNRPVWCPPFRVSERKDTLKRGHQTPPPGARASPSATTPTACLRRVRYGRQAC
jgi:hypothetical protein